ncbi:DUF3307 domain-containing protein [Anaerospora hongkongensis]|uniref:DUF3307 domain-containing protein n=1 Tax=Anaerospora hongkongensis TaxID=244830 RepID=UPI002898D03C|nr:DUF3307 domain-containing protein [Anaerospora hongkongensis]
MNPFLYLLLAHYLADFPLQSDFLASMKGKNNYLLLCHVLIYSLLVGAVLDFLGIYALWKLALLIVSHAVIDYWKCHYAPKDTALTSGLYIDQTLHVLILLILLF